MAKPASQKELIRAFRRNGWALVFYRNFHEALEAAVSEVERLKVSSPDRWEAHPRAKLLKRIVDLVYDQIPADPADPSFEQGNTLGKDARAWRRAKFLQRFRLFFRFNSARRIIVYAWVNDENTLRARGSNTDPYTVFSGMLTAGDPPNGWDALLEACRGEPQSPLLASKFGAMTAIEEPPKSSLESAAPARRPKRK